MLLLLISLVGLMAAVAGILFALWTRRRGMARTILGACVVWGAVYFVILLAVSLLSGERALARGEEKAFCGFYFDCHLHASVTDVRRTKTLGNPANPRTARGNYFIVTVRISSDARGATLTPHNLIATVTDDAGRAYARDLDAERALEETEGDDPSFKRPVEANASYTKRLVFDLPEDARGATLHVSEGPFVERLFEFFIIGDEDSLLHRRTLHRLDA